MSELTVGELFAFRYRPLTRVDAPLHCVIGHTVTRLKLRRLIGYGLMDRASVDGRKWNERTRWSDPDSP